MMCMPELPSFRSIYFFLASRMRAYFRRALSSWSRNCPEFTAMKASGLLTAAQATMATQTPAPKRKRGGSPSPSSSTTTSTTAGGGYATMGISLLSSVTKSVTKRMRLGYDYALGGGTTNGDSDLNGGGAGGVDTSSSATPAAHAHRGTLPRKEFGSPVVTGVGGIGSPPFAMSTNTNTAPGASSAAGASAAAGAALAAGAAGGGGGNKVGFTPFSDGKKTSDGGKFYSWLSEHSIRWPRRFFCFCI